MAQANAYLNFGGNCEEAFEFYRSVLGGEFRTVSRFSDMPPDVPSEPADSDKIMHISLPIGDSVLMGSDVPSSMGQVTAGNNVHVSLTPDNADDGERILTALSEGGTVTMPYEKQFWGDYYGSCMDRFGINWMVDFPAEEPAAPQ